MTITKKKIYSKKGSASTLILLLILFLIFGVAAFSHFNPNFFSESYVAESYEGDDEISLENEFIPSNLDNKEEKEESNKKEEEDTDIDNYGEEVKVSYIEVPEAVKAIYMSACVAGTPSFRNDLVQLVEETELNSIIIDIKDFSGSIAFPTNNPKLKPAWDKADCGARDIKEFIAKLHEKGIYVIGRITVFQDPFYADLNPEIAVQKESDKSTWKDFKGLSFIDAGSKEYWNYIVELSNESHKLGFDELNYDYVRFPSDGNMNDIFYPISEDEINSDPDFGKAKVVESFFSYLDENIRKGLPEDPNQRPIISADLFGMVTTNYDDLNIGQVLERGLPYFDYIAPMVYPSHYPDGFNGHENPNDYPYEIIHYSMSIAVDRIKQMTSDYGSGVSLASSTISTSTTNSVSIKNKNKIHKLQLRPWLQDFDYGGNYGPKEVRDQIQATYDSGLTSWMLWAPSNRYTKEALLSPDGE